jgi:hypothetical protein
MEKEQHKQEQTSKRKPIGSKQKTALAERRFTGIRDLLYLEFSLDGTNTISVYDATPLQMDTFARFYSDVTDVDPNVWPVGERLDFVNGLWDFCQQKHFNFPLQIREGIKPLAETVDKGNALNLASKKALNLAETS